MRSQGPRLAALFAAYCAAGGGAALAAPRWNPLSLGPFAVGSPVSVQGTNESANLTNFKLTIFAPDVDGDFPVIAFVPGFGYFPKEYSSVLRHIASHGFVIVGLAIDPLRVAAQGAMARAKDVATVLSFVVQENSSALEAAFRGAGGRPGVSFDGADRLGLLAHSIGGHAALAAIDVFSCFNVRFVALYDPVDGNDPFGLRPQYLLPLGVHPEIQLKFDTPVLLLTSGLAGDALPYPRVLHWPACAPDDRSGYHWWASMASPKWLVNFTDYGHLDLMDPRFPDSGKIVCPTGSGAATPGGRDVYRRAVAGLTVALAQAVTPGVPKAADVPQEERLRWLEDPMAQLAGALNATALARRGALPVPGGCRWRSPPGADKAPGEALLM